MRAALLRLFACFNLAVALACLVFLLPFWLRFFELGNAPPLPEALEKWQEDRATCIQMAGILSLYFVLLIASGWTLLRKSGWGRPVNLALGGVMTVQAVWHTIQAFREKTFSQDFGIILFLVCYAALIGLLLIPGIPKDSRNSSPR